MPAALEALLIEIGLQELKVLLPELGQLLIAAIAALVVRLRTNNPTVNTVVDDASKLAMDTVSAMEGIDWGSYFSKDDVNKLKAQAALNDLLGKAGDRGIVLATNDAELLIRNAVEVLRTKVADVVEG